MGTRALAAVSAAQLLSGVAGLGLAARRRTPSDPLGVHLNVPRDHIVRNSVVLGTGQSAPLVMMALQAWATARLTRAADPRAVRVLRVLGAVMVFGYLVERGSPLWRGHRDPVGTPVFLVGLAGAVGMLTLAGPAAGPAAGPGVRRAAC
jgi:hypothetical protein